MRKKLVVFAGVCVLLGLVLWRFVVYSPPEFTIVHVALLGSVWGEGQAAASIVSQDGGQSFPVPGGSLWVFGDTFRGSRDTSGTPHFHDGGISCAIAYLPDGSRTFPPLLRYRKNGSGLAETPFTFLDNESWDTHRI